MSQRKGLPGIPPDVSNSLRPLLQALIEQAEVGAGQRGEAKERFVTLAELETIGAVEITNLAALRSRGIDSDTVVLTNNTATISQPEKLSGPVLTGGKTRIVLSWNYPVYDGHAYTEIWRSSTDDRTDAVLVAREAQFIYSDPVDPGATYFYWLRNVGVDGKIGAWHGTAGLEAATDKLGKDEITVTELSAFTANLGTITAGVLQSADGKMIIDLTRKFIYIR